MRAKGINGEVEVAGDLVTLRHRRLLNEGAICTIRVADLTGVDWISPKMFGPGFIRLRDQASNAASDPTKDLMSMGLDFSEQGDFKTIYSELYERVYGVPMADERAQRGTALAAAYALVIALLVAVIFYLRAGGGPQ